MRIAETEVDGYRTCSRPQVADGDRWPDSMLLDDVCEGYTTSQPVRVLRREVTRTFRDRGAEALPGSNVDLDETSEVTFLPADPADWRCPFCGWERCTFTAEPRVSYPRRSRQDPAELVRVTRGLGQRQAAAAEAQAQAAAQGLELQRAELALRQREIELRERELAALPQNGHESAVAEHPDTSPSGGRRARQKG